MVLKNIVHLLLPTCSSIATVLLTRPPNILSHLRPLRFSFPGPATLSTSQSTQTKHTLQTKHNHPADLSFLGLPPYQTEASGLNGLSKFSLLNTWDFLHFCLDYLLYAPGKKSDPVNSNYDQFFLSIREYINIVLPVCTCMLGHSVMSSSLWPFEL